MEVELKKGKFTKIEILNEILYIIISYITPKEVIQLSLVNKEWKNVCFSDFYWERIAKKTYIDYLEAKQIKNNFYSFLKDIWTFHFEESNLLDYGQINKNIFQPLKNVFSIKMQNDESLGGSVMEYNDSLIICYNDSIQSVSKKDMKVLWKIDFVETHQVQLDVLLQTLYTLVEERYFVFLSDSGKEIKRFEIGENERVIQFIKKFDIIITYSIPCLYLDNDEDEKDYPELPNESYLRAYTFDGEFLWKMTIDKFQSERVMMNYHKKSLFLYEGRAESNTIQMFLFEFQSLKKKPTMSTLTFEALFIEPKLFINDLFIVIVSFPSGKMSLFAINIKFKENSKENTKMIKNLVKLDIIEYYYNKINNEIMEISQDYHNTIFVNIYDKNFNLKTSFNQQFNQELENIYFNNNDNFIFTSMDITKKLIHFYVLSKVSNCWIDTKSKIQQYQMKL